MKLANFEKALALVSKHKKAKEAITRLTPRRVKVTRRPEPTPEDPNPAPVVTDGEKVAPAYEDLATGLHYIYSHLGEAAIFDLALFMRDKIEAQAGNLERELETL